MRSHRNDRTWYVALMAFPIAVIDDCVIGDCDTSEPASQPTNTDLEDLGIALLNCMDPSSTDLTATRVRECRASNKVFGLKDPERWSEHKRLVDFIDDLFSIQRRPAAKFEKAVRPKKQTRRHGKY
jgi:hypothetical protein